MPAEMLADAYRYMIEKGNQGVYKDFIHHIGMGDMTPTLEQHIEHLTTLDTSLNKSQPGSGSNPYTNTNMKASARNIDSKKGVTKSTAGQGINNSLTFYIWGQVSQISCNWPNCDLMK